MVEARTRRQPTIAELDHFVGGPPPAIRGGAGGGGAIIHVALHPRRRPP